jgi:outer membrane lipopolysaccharide assembly protein LptE/RlpB
MSKIHGNGIAPFRFLTPFPHRPPQSISEGQWVEKTVWKAERAWFLDRRKRRAKPGIEPFLTRWGKIGVFSKSTGLSFLKHTRRPISSASLEERIGKAKSSRSLLPIPCILPTLPGREPKKLIVLLFVCMLLVQCGYHLRGTGSFLPPHIKRVNVPMFKNLTTRFELDMKLTHSVIDELVARGKVEIAEDMQTADAVLIGEIVSFKATPIAFARDASADRYNIIVVTRITLKDLVTKKVIFSNPNFRYYEEYEVPEGLDFETVESEALDKIAEKFARSLVTNILEGF